MYTTKAVNILKKRSFNHLFLQMELWQIWIIAGILLLIVENFIPTFIAASIAIGCLVAGLFSFLGFGIEGQFVAFSAGILLSFFGIRPIMSKYGHRKHKEIKTNVDSLVGKKGRVVEALDTENSRGRILVEGDDWKAESEDGKPIAFGKQVQILEVNSTILIVKEIK